MLENFVLFHIRGEPWSLGGVCVALAVAALVVWLCALPLMVSRYGGSRRMSTQEAQRRVFVGRDQTYLTGQILAGPAAGKEWAVSFTIGGLRVMRQQGERWWLPPAYATVLLFVFILGGLGLALLTRHALFLAFSGAGVLFMLLIAFMTWASVYTQLE